MMIVSQVSPYLPDFRELVPPSRSILCNKLAVFYDFDGAAAAGRAEIRD